MLSCVVLSVMHVLCYVGCCMLYVVCVVLGIVLSVVCCVVLYCLVSPLSQGTVCIDNPKGWRCGNYYIWLPWWPCVQIRSKGCPGEHFR